MPHRCFLGCRRDLAVHLHRFPNFTRFPEQFKQWVAIVGGQLNTPDDYEFFANKRLCDRHFTEQDNNRHSRLNALAVPTRFLRNEPADHHVTEPDLTMDAPLLQITALTDSIKDVPSDHNVTEPDLTMDAPLLQITALTDSIKGITVPKVSSLLQEIDMNIPFLQTQTGKKINKENPAARESVNIGDPIVCTSYLMEGSVAQNTGSSAACTSTNVNKSPPKTIIAHGAFTDNSAAGNSVNFRDPVVCTSSVVEGSVAQDTGSSAACTSTNVNKSHPKSSLGHGAITGSRASTFLEHNYCKLRVSEKYDGAALEVLFKKSTWSSKNRVEARQIGHLKQQIKSLRKRCTTFKNRLASATKMSEDSAFQKVTKNMTSPAKLFTKMQFSQTHKKPSGRRFSLEEKILSLSLYKRSPKCYSLLAHCFTLPSKKTLKGILAQVKLGPGLNEKIFDQLKKTVSEMSTEDRLCSIIFDEMSLTPQIFYDMANDRLKGFVSTGDHKNDSLIADHVLVFMVKGIKAKFKQPVAYHFTNSINKTTLKNLIKDVIKKVQATGLIVLCSVCDQSSVNVGAISELIQESKNKFLRQGMEWRHDFFEINKKKIIPLYDVPHLLKGLRNNLITKDLTYTDPDEENKEKIVKWKHFQEIYDADKTFGELRLLNKITEEHVNPLKIKKMRVKTAAQLFSHSVAVMAEHLTARGLVNEDCRHLIPLVSLVDKLFDSLNSSTFHIPNGKIYKGCVKKSSPHHRLWTKAKIVLKSMKFIARKKTGDKIRLVTSTVPTTKNFIKTIEGFEELWNILSNKYLFDCMLTRHFNQDPVENFFGNIRSYGARNNSPNVVAFEGAFKALLLNNFNSPHSVKSNCEKDDNKCLQTLDYFISQKSDEIVNEGVPEENLEINEDILMEKEMEKDLGQRNYVCGWVVTKCLKNVVKGCVTCKSKLMCKKDNECNDYIKSKEYNKNKKWLTYPSEDAVNFFYEIQRNTVSLLKQNVPTIFLKYKIKLITNTFTDFSCDCDVHKDQLKEYFMNTTINILINSWCREINRILSGKVSYDGDDEMKKAAQMYHNKHKHNKNNK